MSSRTTYMLEGEALEAVRMHCQRASLEIRGARRRGAALELLPVSLDDLPNAETLRELADLLGGDGIRYVSLSLDETP